MEHKISRAGAAHNDSGLPLHPDSRSIAGRGRAKCSCGWLSDEFDTAADRKRTFSEHREAAEDLIGGVALDPVELDLEPDSPETYAADVTWPDRVGRIFWSPMARKGAALVAQARGLSSASNESRSELRITGPVESREEIQGLADLMPSLFLSANQALKAWRKTSDFYKSFSMATSEGRRGGWIAEKEFLQGWFLGYVRGPRVHLSELSGELGYEAGAAYREAAEAI